MEVYQSDKELDKLFRDTFNDNSRNHHISINRRETVRQRSHKRPVVVAYAPFMFDSDEIFEALAKEFDESFFTEHPELIPEVDPITGQAYTEDEFAMEGDLF